MKAGFVVKEPGMLSLIQDTGRFGHHDIGLTTGGPMDLPAFKWANKLCSNLANTAAIEISFGGLRLESMVDTVIAVTGANMPLMINGIEQALWQTHRIKSGDLIHVGLAKEGCRCYLAVAGGFQVQANFDSVATVMREGIGGLDGNKLKTNDLLVCDENEVAKLFSLKNKDRPNYLLNNSQSIKLRMILGYQHQQFDHVQQQIFFSSDYEVSDRCDRMGYRLQGPSIHSKIASMLSEGICYGAIQIPADGQPIILLNDRQTIGGYPKIGSVISVDTGALAQCMPGKQISFEAISIESAHNLLHLSERKFQSTELLRL